MNQLLIDKQRNKSIYGALALLLLVLIAIAVLAPAVAGKTDVEANATNTSSENTTDDRDLFSDKAYPVYATGYSVEYHGTYKVVQIHDPWGRAAENRTYLLVQRGEQVPTGYSNARVFTIPVKSVIPLSLTHLPCIAAIGETSSIVGFNGINGVYGDDEEFNSLVSEGKIVEVGGSTNTMSSSQLDTEKMIDLSPDVVFCSEQSPEYSEYDNQPKLLEAGLKPAVIGEWMENDPLGRAEWIKYYSLFYNKEKVANDEFDEIVQDYTSVKAKAADVSYRPTLFSGFEYNGVFYADGNKSYVGQLLWDAGGDYILGNLTEDSGSVELDFESVYDRAQSAEFWMNAGYYAINLTDILALDERNSKFDAFKNRKIYIFNARVNANGANDYWQSAVVHPDIVLEDLVKILHPELVPDHELYYYRQITDSDSENETGDNSSSGSDSSTDSSSSSSGSSSGSGGGGAGGSPEPQSNVETKELSQTYIGNGQSVNFDFPQKVTPVMNISFNSKKTTGKTTTIVEMLKNQSTLVSEPPVSEVYEYINIWVGNSGFATPENIENAKVEFKVEKSWIQDKNIDKSSITLNRYSDSKWNALPSSLSGEDDKFLYYTAETPGFSSFAVTGQGTTVKANVTETKSENQAGPNIGSIEHNASSAANEQTPSQSESSDKKTPGFEIVYGIICLFVVFLHKRK